MLKAAIFPLLLVIGLAHADKLSVSTIESEQAHICFLKEDYYRSLVCFTSALKKSDPRYQQSRIAEILSGISECLLQLKQYGALDKTLSVSKPYAQQCHSAAYTKLLLTEAKYRIEKGKYADAIHLLRTTSTLIHDKNLSDECKLLLGDAFFRLDSFTVSKSLFDAVYHTAEDSLLRAKACNHIGSWYYLESEFDSATVYYNKSHEIYERRLGKQHTKTAQVIYNLGLLAGQNGDYYTSQQNFREALRIYRLKFGENHPRTAEAYAALGGAYLNTDNIEKAVYYFKKDRAILQKLYGNNQPDIIYSYLNCGTAYYYLQDYVNAEAQLRMAMQLTEKFYSQNHNLYSQCILELSKMLTERKLFQEADLKLKDIIAVHQKERNEFLADAYYQSGNNYLAQKNTARASYYFSEANGLYNEIYGDNNMYSIDALTGLSNVSLLDNHPSKALEYATAALNQTLLSGKIIHPYDHWECILQTLKCRQAIYKTKQPGIKTIKADIDLIKTTLQEANKIKQTYYSAGSRLYYSQKITKLNELGIFLLTHFYKPTDAYLIQHLILFAENNKANLLRSRIADYTSNEILPAGEQQQSERIIGKLNYFMLLQEDRDSESPSLNDSILFYQNAYEDFSKKIEQEYPKIYALKYGEKQLSIQQLQQHLQSGQTMLLYMNDGENYYCISVSRSKIIYKDCGSKKHIDSLITNLNTSITQKKYDAVTGYTLYKALLPMLLEKDIIIAPDELLQSLAFEALVSHPKKPDYLIYHHSVQYAFSAGTYFNYPKTDDNPTILFFAPDYSSTAFAPLNTQEEFSSLRSHSRFDGRTGKAATKASFIEKTSNTGIVHITAHILVDSISPLSSALVFQPAVNYLLSISEIWKLNIHAQLMTIAACKGNFGKQQGGEGMQNFAWAFHYAGADNVLSTQWNASDKSTGQILSTFYQSLFSGTSKSEALQSAKINYIRNADAIGSQPFYWANYTLYGNSHPIRLSINFLSKFWWIPVIFFIVCYLALISIHRITKKPAS
ncbi:MAG: CHAT domain-containing protein [Sphingobacteriales bacterium]|nr:CHAT domain-containing protein [Sphingobacteriales bacterium]